LGGSDILSQIRIGSLPLTSGDLGFSWLHPKPPTFTGSRCAGGSFAYPGSGDPAGAVFPLFRRPNVTVDIECDDGRLTYFFMHEPCELRVTPHRYKARPADGTAAVNFIDDKGLKVGVLLDGPQVAYLQQKLWETQKETT
jgi:hypothetical protein